MLPSPQHVGDAAEGSSHAKEPCYTRRPMPLRIALDALSETPRSFAFDLHVDADLPALFADTPLQPEPTEARLVLKAHRGGERVYVHGQLTLSAGLACDTCSHGLVASFALERRGVWMAAGDIDEESEDFADAWPLSESYVELEDFLREEILLALPLSLSCDGHEEGVSLRAREACGSPKRTRVSSLVAAAGPPGRSWNVFEDAFRKAETPQDDESN